MFGVIYTRVSRFLRRNQKELFELSLLYVFMSVLMLVLSGLVPIIGIAAALVLSAGMRLVFLSAYERKGIQAATLFSGFSDIKRVLPGMLLAFFKTVVWIFVPFIGIFAVVMKAYEYRFVPYILMTMPEIKAADAIVLSSKETKGFKKGMFLSDALIFCVLLIALGILYLLTKIPFVGVAFAAMIIIISGIALLFMTFIRGIISASFYFEIKNKTIKPKNTSVICPCCGAKVDSEGQFCSNCGEKLIRSV